MPFRKRRCLPLALFLVCALVLGASAQDVGIGVALEKVDEHFEVKVILPDSPAAQTGKIKKGDKILSIREDGGEAKPVAGLLMSQVVSLIRGKPGSTVYLTVASGDFSLKEIAVTRTLDLSRVVNVEVKPRGLAEMYPADKGIESDAAVWRATGLESDFWMHGFKVEGRDTIKVVGAGEGNGFQPLDGKALSLKIKKGGHYGASIAYRFRDQPGGEPEEVYFRYYLRLGDDWDPISGGKLPGISGTYGRAGWGGRPSNGENGWSARGQFSKRKDGRTGIGFYCYHADMKGRYGNSWIWDKDDLGFLENNRWYCIEQHVRMNTPGRNNGILRGWIDGKLAFERTDLRFRDTDELKIENIWINLYHGGSAVAKEDHHIYMDNLVVSRKYIGPMKEVGK